MGEHGALCGIRGCAHAWRRVLMVSGAGRTAEKVKGAGAVNVQPVRTRNTQGVIVNATELVPAVIAAIAALNITASAVVTVTARNN